MTPTEGELSRRKKLLIQKSNVQKVREPFPSKQPSRDEQDIYGNQRHSAWAPSCGLRTTDFSASGILKCQSQLEMGKMEVKKMEGTSNSSC